MTSKKKTYYLVDTTRMEFVYYHGKPKKMKDKAKSCGHTGTCTCQNDIWDRSPFKDMSMDLQGYQWPSLKAIKDYIFEQAEGEELDDLHRLGYAVMTAEKMYTVEAEVKHVINEENVNA